MPPEIASSAGRDAKQTPELVPQLVTRLSTPFVGMRSGTHTNLLVKVLDESHVLGRTWHGKHRGAWVRRRVVESEPVNQSEWSRVFDVCGLLKRTTDSLALKDDREWLRYVLREAASGMQSSVLWAAETEPSAPGGMGETSRLARYVVAADAARSDAVVALYCLDFMRSEHLINEEIARRVNEQLTDVEGALRSLAHRLRGDS